MSETDTAKGVTGEDEVVDLCRELIRIDTSNYGDHSGPGERKAAEYVAEKLAEVGLEPKIFESHPGRASTVARIEGEDPSRPALLIHGHPDVVPANADDWTHDPFSGEIADGCVWGRGAVDMKDMDAMTLAVVRDRLRSGRKPPRDIVLAFLADEEAGGTYGARYLVDNHPELFEGVTEAISEVGGFSFTVNEQRRLYLIQTAEKGMHWMKLTVAGTAGHGSMIHRDNAITELSRGRRARSAATSSRCGSPRRPAAFLDELGDALGTELDPEDMEATLAKLGGIAKLIGATLRNTANPTQLGAGYKVNVIPGAGHRARRRPLPAGLRGGVPRRPRPDPRPEGAPRGRACGQGRRDQLRRRPGGGHAVRAAGRGPDRACGAVHALRRHGRQVLRRPRHPGLRLRAAQAAAGAGLRRACSTAWTSGCRWTGSSSACGCSTGSSTPPEPRRSGTGSARR